MLFFLFLSFYGYAVMGEQAHRLAGLQTFGLLACLPFSLMALNMESSSAHLPVY